MVFQKDRYGQYTGHRASSGSLPDSEPARASSWDCGDSTYSSTSEAELDSDQDDDITDPQKLLNTWLGELENLKLGLDHVGVHASGGSTGVVVKVAHSPVDRLALSAPRFDSYRFSRANLEESQDVELDAILGELCVLESQFDKEIKQRGHARSASAVSSSLDQPVPQRNSLPAVCTPLTPGSGGPPLLSAPSVGGHQKHMGHSRSSSGGSRPKFDIHIESEPDDSMKNMKGEFGLRTDSPDNDSAFSDNVSMLSSESSASSGGGGVAARNDLSSHHSLSSSKNSGLSLASSPTQLLDHISKRLQAIQVEVEKTNGPPAEQAARIKAEKIKIALEKIKEASIKKLFIKAFSADNSAKSLLVDERMTVGHICHMLADKNHVAMDPKWALVEQIPELYMERIYEDHESLVENLLMWTRDSPNKLLFLERSQKYDLFINPEDYLLGSSSSERGSDLDDDGKLVLIEEFFSTSGVTVPEVEGPLYLKSDGKKAWKKYFFVLRASGLYYSPKGRSKFSKDLVCLTTFEMNNVYLGLNWRKKYKAPTDFGFAIKHPQIQTKSSKYIKYLCADDEWTLRQWVVGIRIAKYGRQLKDSYDNLMRNMEEEDLDTLAHARSFSICSMAKTLQVSPDRSTSPDSPLRELKRQSVGHHNDYSGLSQHLQLQHQLYQQRRERESSPDMDSRNSTPTPAGLEHGQRHCVMSRQDSIKSSASSSSGCMSERSSMGTPTAEPIAFEADFPTGTIKRKPSMTPKIPLTSTTRSIAKQSVGEENLSQVVQGETISLSGSSSSSSSGSVGSLGRSSANRFSLRRSQTDDRIHVNGIFRNLAKQSAELAATKRSLGMVDKDPDDLPLPPPPLEMDSIIEGVDDDGLPPPPPEAFKGSTLSLDSLPPPPPPKLEDEPSWPSTSSLGSLPPPPSPLNLSPPESEKASPVVTPKPIDSSTKTRYRRLSETDVVLPPYLEELKQGQNGLSPPHTLRKGTWRKASADPSVICYGTHPRTSNSSSASPSSSSSSSSLRSSSTLSPSNSLSPKKGQYRVSSSPASPSSSYPTSPQDPPADVGRRPRSQSKPPPPQRSNVTQLTQGVAVQRSPSITSADGNPAAGVTPKSPETFLKNLQRVMERKWKVAQQLSNDHSATPHQILGFRDPCYLPPAENDVRCGGANGNNQYLDISSRAAASRLSQISPDDASRTFVISRKKAPPPPPRRSETTQLTRRQLTKASE